MFFTFQEINQSLEKEKVAGDIIKDVFDLTTVTNDYILHKESRAIAQWQLKYDSISELLESKEFESGKERDFFYSIKENHEELRGVFSELVENSEKYDKSQELEDRLSTQLQIRSQLMVSNSFQLAELIRSDVQNTKQTADTLTTIFILILISATIGNAFLLRHAISNPIKKIEKVIKRIETGDFEAKVDIHTGDMFERLGNALNRSTERLKKIDEEHKQIDKAKTEFLTITSHELRSPMTPMRAQLQMLMEDYFGKLNKKQRESIDIILRNTTRLDRIITDFLEISRIEAARLKFKFVKTDLTKNVRRLIKEIDSLLPEKKIQIVAKIGKLPIIEVDPDRVMQVLRNLLNNAKKFSKEKGKIYLTAEVKNNMIQFTVKDSGIGISSENVNKIFEPFFQEAQAWSRKYGGTGLGLTICKGIIESQNGKIWVESELGKGTTFYFTVPLTPVREIKSIRMLFSPGKDIEKKVRDIFHNYLGPMGEIEFEMVNKVGLKHGIIVALLDKIRSRKILEEETYLRMMLEINLAFGVRKTKTKIDLPKKIEKIYSDMLGDMGPKEFGKVKGNLNIDEILENINNLRKSKILTEKKATEFKRRIYITFKTGENE